MFEMTVSGRSKMSKKEKVGNFQDALKKSLLDQIDRMPLTFHPSILENQQTYAEKFSSHLIEKIQSRSVVVINETVSDALRSMNMSVSLSDLYSIFELDVPEMSFEDRREEIEEPRSSRNPFRGC